MKPAGIMRLWPRSLTGQLLLSLAAALLLAQAISATLLYRSQHERREAALVHTAAFRLIGAARTAERTERAERSERAEHHSARERPLGPPPELEGAPISTRPERMGATPFRPGDRRMKEAEEELEHILRAQDLSVADLAVVMRNVGDDPVALRRLERRYRLLGDHAEDLASRRVVVAAVRPEGSAQWLAVRVFVPPGERVIVLSLIGQTLLIYGLLVGAIALIVRRITRPLAALTTRLERFADTRDADGQLAPEGPDDVRRLIVAHNAMEARIAALLDEKDVMLGAIGHDLKTPLAALRVRIETVDDDHERARMAATIEDITRTLDDILSLARVGRPTDPREATELSALVASVVEEYEDMGENVTLGDTRRVVIPLRATWLRRALRNLIGNALRYGGAARVSLDREGAAAVIRIEDDGPGIAEDRIERMMEPFARGEPSRNSETGGAGLGLALARAIAEQHGGTLKLANRVEGGKVAGLVAELRLPAG